MATFKAKVLMQRFDFPLLFSMARRFSVRLPTKLKRLQVSDSLFAFSSLTMTNKPNIQSTGMEKTLNKHTDMEETLNKHTDMEETQKTHRHWKTKDIEETKKKQKDMEKKKLTQIHGKNFQVADSLSACKPFKEEFGNCKLANLKRCLVKVRVRVNWKWWLSWILNLYVNCFWPISWSTSRCSRWDGRKNIDDDHLHP